MQSFPAGIDEKGFCRLLLQDESKTMARICSQQAITQPDEWKIFCSVNLLITLTRYNRMLKNYMDLVQACHKAQPKRITFYNGYTTDCP